MVEEDAADTLTEILKQAYENKKKDWNEEETNYVEKQLSCNKLIEVGHDI